MVKGELSEKEEMLLSKYFDKECSWFESIRAKRLLTRSQIASDYINSLQGLSNSIKKHAESPKPELWFRVAARINVEEKTAGLLGTRTFSTQSSIWRDRMIGGLVGACAVVIFMIVPKTTPMNSSEMTQQALNQPSLAEEAPHGGVVPVRSFNSVARNEPVAVEVDWVRSDGRVQVIHGDEDRAPIIWVKRRENNSQGIIMMNKDRDVPRGITVSNR